MKLVCKDSLIIATVLALSYTIDAGVQSAAGRVSDDLFAKAIASRRTTLTKTLKGVKRLFLLNVLKSPEIQTKFVKDLKQLGVLVIQGKPTKSKLATAAIIVTETVHQDSTREISLAIMQKCSLKRDHSCTFAAITYMDSVHVHDGDQAKGIQTLTDRFIQNFRSANASK